MAQDNGSWEDAPQGANSLQAKMLVNDARLQTVNAQWPTGGTAQQLGQESNYSNSATSPKGAVGMAQVMPDTLKAVEQQTGRKLDPRNANDALEIQRYVMDQNLHHFGSVPDALAGYNGGWDPTKWNNSETQNYVSNFNKGIASRQGWEDAPAQDQGGIQPVNYSPAQQPAAPVNAGGWEDAPAAMQTGAPSPAQTRANAFMSTARQQGMGAANALQGAGEAVLNMTTGGAGMIAGGYKGLYDLATGNGDQATQDIENTQNALTYQPRTPQGQQFAQKLGQGFGAVQGAMEQGAVSAMGAIPFIGQDLAKSSTAQEVAKTAADVVANVGPMLAGLGPKGARLAKGEVTKGGAEVDKINSLNTTPAEPPDPMAPNEGPQRPIVVDSQGNAYPMGSAGRQAPMDADVAGAEAGKARQQAVEQQAAGDLFPDTMQDPTGQASPLEPNRLSGDVQSPLDIIGRNRRQGEFDFDTPGTPDTLLTNAAGETGTPSQFREGGPVDVMKSRIADMQHTPVEALDPQGGVPHPVEEAATTPRTLAPDEFTQAVESLVDRDPKTFSMPSDMSRAYDQYMNIARDETGGLRSKSKSAAQFADAVSKEIKDQQVANHPVVKSNQARVNALQARLQDLRSKQAPTSAVERALNKATDTLEKSQKNIAKVLGDDPRLPWERDGAVNMYTFGHLPEMFRSLGAVFKALHGMVFKMIDRLLPANRNLNSTGKIIGQGMKDFANKQATRDWDQTVNAKPVKQLSKIEALREGIREYNPFEGQEITPEQLKTQMTSAPDISGNIRSKIAQNILQGGLQLTNMVKHPLVKFATESVDRAMRNSKSYVKNNLVGPDGLRTKMQKMSDDELTGVRTLMEMNEGKKEFNAQQLRNAGFSDKQIAYYEQSLKEDRAAFDRFNDARQQAGLKPVDRRIAHIAGYFLGDFRSVITDKEGKVVAVVAHNLRPAVNTIVKHFIDNHPDGASLKASPVQLRKLNEAIGSADNRFHGYMEVLNVLKDTNADVGRVVDAYQNYITKDAQAAMADRAKFKSDTAVLGAEGRKAWQDAQTNAKEGARQQLHYLESINKWAEMQGAIRKVGGYLADPEINAPNAKALSQDYIDAVQGRNRGPMQKLLNAMMNGVAEATGVGPSVWKGMNNATKSALLAKFVGIFKLSHSAVTLLQPLQAMPTINARIAARGADLGAASVSSVGKALSSSYRLFADNAKDGFEKRAVQYMKDNNTTDVGMSFHLQNVSKGSARSEAIRHIAELNVRIPETGARTFTFMYYAHMLKELGLPEKEVFGTAHNLMRDAMVDYAPHERSLMFGKMGILGDIASTLTRFKYNQIGQHMVGWHDWRAGGSAAPLLTTVATSVLLGGVRGVFAYEAANQILDKVSTFAASHGLMKQPTNLDEIVLKSLHGMNNHVADLLNWGIPAAVGVNLTGSLTNADTIPTDPLGSLFPTGSEFQNLGSSAGEFLMHPNKNTAQKAALTWMPNSMKGMAEDAFFTKDGKYTNPQTGKLEARRDTTAEVQRLLSFRPLQEGKDSLVARTENNRQENLNTVRHSILEQAHSDILSNTDGRLTPAQMSGYVKRYIATGADPQSFATDLQQFVGMDQNRTRLERAQGIPTGSISGLNKYTDVQKMK